MLGRKDLERASECPVGERELAVGEECLTPGLSGIRFAPGIATVRMSGEVQRFPSCLYRFEWVWPGQPDAGKRDQQQRTQNRYQQQRSRNAEDQTALLAERRCDS